MRRLARWFMNNLIRVGTSILCRIDKSDFQKIPKNGPLILVCNHIGSLEVPLLFVHLQPRRIYGLAKIETWDNKFMGWLFDLWDAIPVRRGELDLNAFRGCLQVLEAGDILAIAPEGTRSRHGRLLRGQPGVVALALRTGIPILPMAHWGGEHFSRNVKRLHRTDFHVRVGRPFLLVTNGRKVDGGVRQEMVDEVMGQIAALMPEAYHGEYTGRAGSTQYLQWI